MECGGGSTPASLGGGKWDGELPGGGRKLAAGLSRVEEARSKGFDTEADMAEAASVLGARAGCSALRNEGGEAKLNFAREWIGIA